MVYLTLTTLTQLMYEGLYAGKRRQEVRSISRHLNTEAEEFSHLSTLTQIHPSTRTRARSHTHTHAYILMY